MKTSVSVQPRWLSAALMALGVGRIDRGGLARFDVVHEIAVIVGAAHEDVDEDGHDCAPGGCMVTNRSRPRAELLRP